MNAMHYRLAKPSVPFSTVLAHDSPQVTTGAQTMTTETSIQDREALIQRCIPFLDEVKYLTAGTTVERWLNENHGPDSELHQTLARMVKRGVEDGWAANVEIDGPTYRRSRIAAPSERPLYFSRRRCDRAVL